MWFPSVSDSSIRVVQCTHDTEHEQSLVSAIHAGDAKIANLFLQCTIYHRTCTERGRIIIELYQCCFDWILVNAPWIKSIWDDLDVLYWHKTGNVFPILGGFLTVYCKLYRLASSLARIYGVLPRFWKYSEFRHFGQHRSLFYQTRSKIPYDTWPLLRNGNTTEFGVLWG